MAEFIFSAFADEAGTTIEEQIQALSENGIRYIEPRQIIKKEFLTCPKPSSQKLKRN